MKVFPRHIVNFSKETLSAVAKVVRNNQVFDGPHIKEFEEEFANYHKVKYARGLFSGSAGLCLVLEAFHFQKNAEILLSAFNYYRVPLVIKAYNLKPVFIDIYPQTFNIDVSQIEKHITPKTRAILITHTFGQPCEMEPIIDIAKRYNLKVIEDCAHSCGAEYKGQKVGTFGDAGIFSFAMGKNIPCFGGGAVITNSDYLWQRLNNIFKECTYPSRTDLLKILLTHFVSYLLTLPEVFPYIAYPILRLLDVFNIALSSYHENPKNLSWSEIVNYQKKIANLQAAVGLCQLKRIDGINEKLRENALLYTALFKEQGMISVPVEIADVKHIYLYYCFTIKKREAFRKMLLKKGVDIEKNHLSNCPAFEMFDECGSAFPASEKLAKESVEIPSNVRLTQDDIRYIVDCIREVIKDMGSETHR